MLGSSGAIVLAEPAEPAAESARDELCIALYAPHAVEEAPDVQERPERRLLSRWLCSSRRT